MGAQIDFGKFVTEFDKFVEAGFCQGAGDRDDNGKFIKGNVCVEQAVSCALGVPNQEDRPKCVKGYVADLKIALNDDIWWPSGKGRAKALRDIGIAQVGSKSLRIKGSTFFKLVARKLRFTDKETKEILDYYYEYGDAHRNRVEDLFTYKKALIDWCQLAGKEEQKRAKRVIEAVIEVLTDLKVPGALYLKNLKRREARRK